MPADPNWDGGLDELKDYWQQRAYEAFDSYLHAVKQHRRMTDELNQGLTPLADGSFAILKARRGLGIARSEFLRVQLVYLDLLLGKRPVPRDDDQRPLL